jgi:hypothetical protein
MRKITEQSEGEGANGGRRGTPLRRVTDMGAGGHQIRVPQPTVDSSTEVFAGISGTVAGAMANWEAQAQGHRVVDAADLAEWSKGPTRRPSGGLGTGPPGKIERAAK